MFDLFKTLFQGASARAEDQLRDHFAVDLMDQKIREAGADLETAKATLASLILKERNEARTLETLRARIADLEERTRQAMAVGQDTLVRDGAEAIAELENEASIRTKTVNTLGERIARMRLSVEKTHRRIVDLRQGMIEARAIDAEHKAQKTVNRTLGRSTSLREAEALIARIKGREDPFEETEVLDAIDAGLNRTDVASRMAAAGFGERTKASAETVLERLAGQTTQTA